ncbi:MAG: hypothetical protein IJU26_02580 [Synergistaceae bacterium]|nr:hypothetical protein [Synergistaceae bacterium]
MFMTKKCLYLPTLAVMLMVFVSFGCGGGGGSGGGSGNTSQSDNLPGWDTPPNPVADNQNNNNYNGNNGSTNQNQNQNQNQNPDTPTNPDTNNQNQDSNNGSDSPVNISGTWEIVSGHGVTTTTISGRTTTSRYTYVPGRIGKIGVEVSRNTWGGTYEGAYCVTLSGNDLIVESTHAGTGDVMLDCVNADNPNQPAQSMIFSGGLAYDYIGNATYQETGESFAKYTGNTQRVMDYEYTLTLEDSSTLRWTYWSKMDMSGVISETQNEIVLKKAQ